MCYPALARGTLRGRLTPDSERFRFAPRTCRPLCPRLQLRKTVRTGRSAAQMAQGEEVPMLDMKRRDFITLLGGAAVAWPLAARAQQPDRKRRIGVLMTLAADDPEGQARLTAFVQGLQELGWTDGRNVQIDYRWPAGDAERIRRYAAELAAL